MSFVSIAFLVFFPFVYLIYISIPVRFRWVWLLCASYAFYGYWDWLYIPLLVCSTLTDYYCAIKMEQSKSQDKRKIWLGISLLCNLSILFYFKYSYFLSVNVSSLFKLDLDFESLILPLGISFYTLQTLGYSFDVYLKKTRPERHLGYFSLYVCFFPQLVAGPIERSRSLLPQLKNLVGPNVLQFRKGILLVIWGVFLKLVIADNLTHFVDHVYFSGDKFSLWIYWIVGGLVIIKVYCDFMAYSEIARGIGAMLGVRLMNNFARPLLASNLRGFWKRWHISLTRWIGDYIQVPLMKKTSTEFQKVLVTTFTLLVVGIWHGASWNFIMFGLFHGLVIALWSPVASWFSITFNASQSVRKLFGRIFLAFTLIISGPMFYITDTQLLFSTLNNMFLASSNTISVIELQGKYALLVAGFGFLVLTVSSFLREYYQVSIISKLSVSGSTLRCLTSFLMILMIIAFGNFASENFIYFEF